jgi:hypothetical protein
VYVVRYFLVGVAIDGGLLYGGGETRVSIEVFSIATWAMGASCCFILKKTMDYR